MHAWYMTFLELHCPPKEHKDKHNDELYAFI